MKGLLQYKKVPYTSIEVHPLNKKEIAFSKDYAKVPILVDAEGNQVNDSTAIMRHLDQEGSVFDGSAFEEKWLKWSDEILVRSLPPLVYRSYNHSLKAFDYITDVEKFSPWQKTLIKYSGALVMRMVAKKSAARQNISDPHTHFNSCLDTWAKALLERESKKTNGADLAIFGILKTLEKLPSFSYLKAHPTVYPWYAELDALMNPS